MPTIQYKQYKRFYGALEQQEAHQFVGQAKRRATQIRPKAVGGGIFGSFSNFGKCRSEEAGKVISGLAAEWVGTDVRATCGECGLNSGRNI